MALGGKVYNRVDILFLKDLFQKCRVGYIALYELIIIGAFNALQVLKVSGIGELIEYNKPKRLEPIKPGQL